VKERVSERGREREKVQKERKEKGKLREQEVRIEDEREI